jgi:hypothetical protein
MRSITVENRIDENSSLKFDRAKAIVDDLLNPNFVHKEGSDLLAALGLEHLSQNEIDFLRAQISGLCKKMNYVASALRSEDQ